MTPRGPWCWLGPILWQPLLPAWARLGPLSAGFQGAENRHRRLIATRFAAIARPMGRLGGFPTGRPWVSLSWSPPCCQRHDPPLPGPIPRIPSLWPTVTGRLEARGVRPAPIRGTLSPRRHRTLAATINPDCLLGVFTPMSFGWPRRWPPTSAVPAFGCFARSSSRGKPDSVLGAFSIFAGQCLMPDD
jgi:hypothetical protein